jgi:hypothetical protein
VFNRLQGVRAFKRGRLKREVLVDPFEVSVREKRSTFVKVLVACLIAAVLAPPLAQAAVTRIKGTVKIKDSAGDRIDSKAVPAMGLFGAAGSNGAVATRVFAGGGGFLGAADCTEALTDGLPNTVSVENSIVTGILITGTNATYTVTSEAIGSGQLPLLNFTVSASNPSIAAALPTGLTLTDALTFTCTAGDNGNVVLLGQ